MNFPGVIRRAVLPLAAVLAASIAVPASAATNLVKNGDFEDSTANNIVLNPTSVGGIGQIQLGSPTSPTEPLIVTLAEWTKTQVTTDGSQGFAFVINADADNRTVGAAYPNQGGGFPSIFSNEKSTNIFLWGPDYGPAPKTNDFSGPPGSSATNKFIGIDGDYGASKISQAVSGFDAAKTYKLSFQYAGAQETGESGDTNQQWKVNLGGLNFDTPIWKNISNGFTAWQTYISSAFSGAGLDGALLSFEAWGQAAAPFTGSLPPFLLLDNVQILENDTPPPPPPPPTPVPGPLPLLGAGMAYGITRRLRRRVMSSKLSAHAG